MDYNYNFYGGGQSCTRRKLFLISLMMVSPRIFIKTVCLLHSVKILVRLNFIIGIILCSIQLLARRVTDIGQSIFRTALVILCLNCWKMLRTLKQNIKLRSESAFTMDDTEAIYHALHFGCYQTVYFSVEV